MIVTFLNASCCDVLAAYVLTHHSIFRGQPDRRYSQISMPIGAHMFNNIFVRYATFQPLKVLQCIREKDVKRFEVLIRPKLNYAKDYQASHDSDDTESFTSIKTMTSYLKKDQSSQRSRVVVVAHGSQTASQGSLQKWSQVLPETNADIQPLQCLLRRDAHALSQIDQTLVVHA